jgi:hypothetical protein
MVMPLVAEKLHVPKTARAEKLGAVLCHLSRRAGSTRSDTALCWVETDPPLLTEPVET